MRRTTYLRQFLITTLHAVLYAGAIACAWTPCATNIARAADPPAAAAPDAASVKKAYWLKVRAMAHAARDELDKALADFDEAMRLTPADAGLYEARGYAYYSCDRIDEAVADLNEAVRLAPDDAEPYALRGFVLAMDRPEQAIADFTAAIGLRPKDAELYRSRGKLLRAQGEYQAACDDFTRIIELKPLRAEARVSRGVARELAGDYAAAIVDYDAAIAMSPKLASAHRDKALLLATCPDAGVRLGAEAIHSATRACELTEWKEPRELAVLAAAYAEMADWEAAEKWQSAAIKLTKEPEWRAAREARLKLFVAHEAYHNTADEIERDRKAWLGERDPIRVVFSKPLLEKETAAADTRNQRK